MRLLPDERTAPASVDQEIAKADREPEADIWELRLQFAVSQMNQSFAMFDGELRLIVCNDAFRAFHALPPELDHPGTSLWDILDNATTRDLTSIGNRQAQRDEVRRFIAEREPRRVVHKVRNGRIISTSLKPLPDGGWISIQEDVTEQQIREQNELKRLREAEAQTMRFQAAIDNMSQGLSMFDPTHRLVACNDSFARLYHLPPELARPGTGFEKILRHRGDHGMLEKGESVDSILQRINNVVTDHAVFRGVVTFESGRVVMINHQPLIDGGWLSTHEDITEQHHNAEIIHFMARHDSLTGLANRATFIEIVADAERGIASGDMMVVFSIDIDRFKNINDAFGHAVGDAVLLAIGDRLRTECDGRSTPARLGGDDFAALVGPLHTAEEALLLAESLLSRLRAPIVVGDTTIFCDAAIGIAIAPEHGCEASQLMHSADLALSAAKANARSACCLFEPNMDLTQRRRQNIEHGLRAAIENDGFGLVYQPLISLETGRVSCCEALLRWESPELGPVSPEEFIPVAEETGLIRQIGVGTLEAACIEAASWPCHIRVAVNVSVVQFRGDDLVEHVAHALMVSGLEPSRLELEITESLFLADDTHNFEVLHRLRELGVRFALDDFGSGYSSLAYLLRFPFDKVKIDRSIVSTIADKPETVTMVTAIVELCKGFNMLTVAEGIESEEQLAEVAAHGCDEVQGYIFSPPLPRSAIGELLRRKQVHASDETLQARSA